MIKMIIADDEPVITRGIQKLVDWNSLGIEVVGEYVDGKEALDGIITLKPDLALLDIQMPKKTGIDILKELKELELTTRIIFISGFQDFQYAKDALTFGAEDYLLKPVIKDELIKAVETCIMKHRQEWKVIQDGNRIFSQTAEPVPYEKLVKMEETTYIPAVVTVIWNGKESVHEKKLARFSILSYIEQYLNENDLGIIFIKNNYMAVVIKGKERKEVRECLYRLSQLVKEQCRHEIGCIVGEPVASMGDIPGGYGACLALEGYFFFSDQITIPVLSTGVPVFRKQVGVEEFSQCRTQLINVMVSHDKEQWEKSYQLFTRFLCIISEGKKEDACFHFCSAIRMVQEKFQSMGLTVPDANTKELLERGRETDNFSQMSCIYKACLEGYMDKLRESLVNNDKKEIMKAKEYIENHYRENLSLEVLAREIHMNPYYFSNFFKKHSGENFKDYLNHVRMKHAVNLLVSTDKKSYEIADEVGFRDARSFADLFQRVYGETPASYRKRVKGVCD